MTIRPRTLYIIYTVLILINEFCFGLTLNSIWPALVDLKHIYEAETMSYAVSLSSFGYVLGALTVMSHKWINRQLANFCLMTMTAMIIIFLPNYGTLTALYVAIVFAGIGLGSWDCSNTLWLIEMWPKYQASIIQTQQFLFGIGSATSAGVMSFFVKGNASDVSDRLRINSLKTPYLIIGILQCIVPGVFLVLFFIAPYIKHDEKLKNESSTNQSPPIRPIKFRKIKLILAAIMFAVYTSAEQGYFFFSDTMLQFWTPKMDADKSATVLATLAAAFTFGRLLTAFISLRLKPDIIIAYHFIIIIISFLWFYVKHDGKLNTYASTAMLGYGFSAMWPAIISFTENHLQLNETTSSVIFLSSGLLTIMTPIMIGDRLEHRSQILILFTSIYLSISLSLFIIVNLLIIFSRYH